MFLIDNSNTTNFLDWTPPETITSLISVFNIVEMCVSSKSNFSLEQKGLVPPCRTQEGALNLKFKEV